MGEKAAKDVYKIFYSFGVQESSSNFKCVLFKFLVCYVFKDDIWFSGTYHFIVGVTLQAADIVIDVIQSFC